MGVVSRASTVDFGWSPSGFYMAPTIMKTGIGRYCALRSVDRSCRFIAWQC